MTPHWRQNERARRDRWPCLALQSNYKLAEMARIAGVTIRQLERYFEQDFGRPPKQWLLEQQMLSALHLLRNTESIKAVAYQLGFKHHSHFSAAFRQHYEMTPLDYVRLWEQNKSHISDSDIELEGMHLPLRVAGT